MIVKAERSFTSTKFEKRHRSAAANVYSRHVMSTTFFSLVNIQSSPKSENTSVLLILNHVLLNSVTKLFDKL